MTSIAYGVLSMIGLTGICKFWWKLYDRPDSSLYMFYLLLSFGVFCVGGFLALINLPY